MAAISSSILAMVASRSVTSDSSSSSLAISISSNALAASALMRSNSSVQDL
jgi:hypothetical protein